MNKKGFTLIEMLIVISIIGLLIAMAGTAYSSGQKRSRDARRRGDMQAIQKAFEEYYSQNSVYNSNCSSMMTGYLVGTVKDPKTQAAYSNTSCGATGYCWCASMEIASSGNANTGSCSFTPGDFFCVTNVQ